MRLHARTIKVTQAHNAMTSAIIELEGEHDLSWAEIVQWHASRIAEATKYMIREERHPDDPNKKGDEA